MKSAAWLCRPVPIEGEILSSFLARIASANGLSPYRFYSFHFPGLSIWNRDIDRSASDEFITGMASYCNVNFEAIDAMTLRDFESAFSLRPKAAPAIAPWINAAGIYHRDRKGFAMQYCPHCLQQESAYKRIWRLSFVTFCEIHGSSLLDCCSHCGVPIVFHRNDVFHPNCHQCGRTLIHKRTQVEDSLNIRQRMQEILLAAAFEKEASIGSQIVTSQELFAGLAILMQAIKTHIRTSRGTPSLLPKIYVECPTERIELLRLQGRAHQCLVLADLISNWPSRFLEIASILKLTQRTFKDMAYPLWLRPAVSELPSGSQRLQRTSVSPIRNKLRSLHRHKHANWRTERAKLLLQKAKGRQ